MNCMNQSFVTILMHIFFFRKFIFLKFFANFEIMTRNYVMIKKKEQKK